MITDDPAIELSFSTDTVFFDTVFTTLGSITKRFKVYNPSENAVNLSSIKLGSGNESSYSVVINGFQGNQLNNIRLLGKDSLLILVEVLIDPQEEDLPFIVQDSLVFETNGNVQDVKLVSWGQDAVFFRGIQAVDCNTTWTSDKPYVIFDTLVVRNNCNLTIEEGTNINFGPNAALIVGGNITVNGSLQRPVIFSGVRKDEGYQEVPGQWGSIQFTTGSKDNIFNWAIIENGTIGIIMGTPDEDNEPDVLISNSIIRSMKALGVQCFNSDLLMVNSLVYRGIIGTVYFSAGGNYELYHNTFAAVSPEFFRDNPSFLVKNYEILSDKSIITDDLSLTMANNIIWGKLEEELFFDFVSEREFDVSASNNLLKTLITEFDANNILNEDPQFLNPSENLFMLDTLGESPVIDQGINLGIETDLAENNRDENPDIGAYEFIK